MRCARQLVIYPRWIFPRGSCCSVVPHTAVTSLSLPMLAAKPQEKDTLYISCKSFSLFPVVYWAQLYRSAQMYQKRTHLKFFRNFLLPHPILKLLLYLIGATSHLPASGLKRPLGSLISATDTILTNKPDNFCPVLPTYYQIRKKFFCTCRSILSCFHCNEKWCLPDVFILTSTTIAY